MWMLFVKLSKYFNVALTRVQIREPMADSTNSTFLSNQIDVSIQLANWKPKNFAQRCKNKFTK